MHSIFLALQSLRTQLAQALPATPGLRHFDVSFPLNDAFDPLAWLGVQRCYPQFYWQQRSGDEELAALGSLAHFDSLASASRFLHTHDVANDTRICGLNAFNPAQGKLFLPRLLWRRSGGVATLRLQLWSETSLREDAREALNFVDNLRDAAPIRPLSVQIVQETHHPEKPEWLALIRQATDTLARGDFEKVVLARATDVHCQQPVNAIALMAASRALNLNCYHFCMVFDASNAFLGSTPERLWRRRGTLLRTEALAGTVASHSDDKQAQRLGDWLMNDDKNQRENMLVAEDIASVFSTIPGRWRSCLRRCCVCARCSIYAAVSGPNLNSLTTSSACIFCNRRRRWPGCRDRRRENLLRKWSRLTGSGTPGRRAIYRAIKANSVWHYAPPAFTTLRCVFMRGRASSAAPIRSRSGRRSKTRPPGCVPFS